MKLNVLKYYLITIISLFLVFTPFKNLSSEELQEVSGLVYIHNNLSAGQLRLEEILKVAKIKDIKILLVTNNYNLKMEYGIPPFRNLFKKKIGAPSVLNSMGIENYLRRFEELNRIFPDMILVPGVETIPFYYWTGSPFSKNLTTHNWEKTFLIFGLNKPNDFKTLPVIHNHYSTKYTLRFIPVSISFLLAFFISIFLIRWKGIFKMIGILVFISSLLFLINYHPLRSTLFTQYNGDQAMLPYQEVIDDVNHKDGLIFWSQRKDNKIDKKIGPIIIKDGFKPRDLILSKNYTGFLITPDKYELTRTGNEWDKILLEYCSNQRKSPAWQIGGFHLNGSSLEKIDTIQTVFLLERRDKISLLAALKRGRTYTRILNNKIGLSLNLFSVSDPKTEIYGIMGEEISLKVSPLIKISVVTLKKNDQEISVNLIRSGNIISTFKGQSPLNITYQDDYFKEGEKVYYRLEIAGDDHSRIITNPIFVKFYSATK